MKLINIPFYLATRIIKKIQFWLGLSTLGARAIVLNAKGQVLLVKHTYEPYWYLPGGGVNKAETTKTAVIRELREETGLIVPPEEPLLFGIYYHTYLGVNDYPVIYVVKNYSSTTAYSREIEVMDWFHYDELPEMISPATKRRLTEYFTHSPQSERW